MLQGKKLVLGVSGSIAAYKASFLVRLLIKAGADVKVVMSPASKDFVSPLTLATLSNNPVLWDYFDREEESDGSWNNHVDLGLWADLIIIAPATSNTLSKMASGSADNLLMGVYMSAKCPVYFAPAMDLDMYQHPSTQENIQKLISFGNKFIEPGDGELASGLVGKGRMAEPEEIISFIEADLLDQSPLKGKTILVNAGPTHEPIDPVRYIGNRSSGRMGIAIAEVAALLGAQVHLVLGPTHLRPQNKSIQTYLINTAQELNNQCLALFGQADIAILSAAVADYRPENVHSSKIKKDGSGLSIKLIENPDVLYNLGVQKKEEQVLVGFALETNDLVANARKKLIKKNCDLIVLNSPSAEGTGFGFETNRVHIIDRNGKEHKTELKTKHEIAQDIFNIILNYKHSSS